MQADTARKEAELREDFNRRLTKKEEEMRREEEALNVRSNEIEAEFERQIRVCWNLKFKLFGDLKQERRYPFGTFWLETRFFAFTCANPLL